MWVFLNSDHELRSGWKFLLFIVFFVLILVPVGILVTIFAAPRGGTQLLDQLALLALNQATLLIPVIGATWLAVKFVDHRPFQTFGIGFLPDWQKHFVTGLGIAAAMLGVL